MRANALVLLCSLSALVGCGTSAVIDRGDGQAGDGSTADAMAMDVPNAVDVPTTDAAEASVDDGSAADASDAGDGGVTPDGGDAGPCSMGQSLCGASCVDLQSNAMNCGMCGRSCPSGTCSMGVCQATCGLAGLPCCIGSTCEEGTTCSAGMCVRGVTEPIYRGSALVSSGRRSNSSNFRLFSTVGQSTQHTRSMTSTNFVLRGGLVGTVGGI